MIPDWASSGAPLIVFLFCMVFPRAQATYWLGRLAASGALTGRGREDWRGRVAAWFEGPVPSKGAALLERWGLVIIPLCFLTVGIQTAVNAGAGLVRLRWHTYTLAMLPGCVAWAVLYGMGMLAVWTAAIEAVAGNPWALGTIGVVLAAAVFTLWHRRHRTQAPVEETCPMRVEAASVDEAI